MQVSPSPTRRPSGPLALAALAITVAAPSIASGHAVLTAPTPRTNRADYKDDNGGAPCGVARTATQPNNSGLTPGAPFMVTWNETVNHPGCFVIDFSASGDTNWQVLSTVAHKTTGNTPRPYTAMVTLPSAPCTACTLRLRQIMQDNAPAGTACPPATIPTNATYYTCANVALGGGDGGVSDAGGGIGGGGAGTGGRGGAGSGGRGGSAGGSSGTGGASSGGATNPGSGGAVTSSGGATNPGSGGAVAASGGATNPGSGGAVNPGSGGATGASGGAGGAAVVFEPEPAPCACGVVTPRSLSTGALLFGALLAMTMVRGRARKRSKPNQPPQGSKETLRC